jgi:hypothetical protein
MRIHPTPYALHANGLTPHKSVRRISAAVRFDFLHTEVGSRQHRVGLTRAVAEVLSLALLTASMMLTRKSGTATSIAFSPEWWSRRKSGGSARGYCNRA